MNTMRIDPNASSDIRAYRFRMHSASSTTRRDPDHPYVPASIPAAQRYFWSALWQKGEAEAIRDIEEGRVKRFEDPIDAIRWLLSDDEDE